MPLFRPYQPKDRTEAAGADVRRATRWDDAPATGAEVDTSTEPESGAAKTKQSATAATSATTPAATTASSTDSIERSTREKNRPTRTRKEAEAERRAKARPNLSKKEARRKVTAERREVRMREMAERDNTPEKKLLRDFFDSRWNLMEFLLPALLVMLAGSMLASALPAASTISLIVMYAFLGLSLLDFWLAWRRFKALLAVRMPRSTPKGLLFYGVNRAMQIRRLRMPPPEVKRGEKI
ncbi:DUF3043 domain-containing protein [Naumannella halotolerans]|uniref:DUF3043 family protein n=1 Tax=Naumannella halotolerans TaxID=993414 RepID=A0A4V3EN75_9ACTN|nr:DUF3043 domain-containing protein [Naumannella halotolerans]TDT32738.1 Protein of unknown function (DUF3043) [Naumannella halotolerans]